jgi:hypothetical protein
VELRFPRTRGDGPEKRSLSSRLQDVSPAHAGMARPSPQPQSPSEPFPPHTRGWTAALHPLCRAAPCFPRTRRDGAANTCRTDRGPRRFPRTHVDEPDQDLEGKTPAPVFGVRTEMAVRRQ